MILRLEEQDGNGNILAIYEWDEPWPALDGIGIVATLNACLGIWTLSDAANAAGVPQDHLIAEAQAWAAASA